MIRKHFTALQYVSLTSEDRLAGVLVSVEVNGTKLKIVKCSQHSELLHVYALDPQEMDFQFDYEYDPADDRVDMIHKITTKLVSMQAALYMQQKEYMKVHGACVNH